VVSATSSIPVGTVSITRTTGTAANTASGGSDNASKTWVDANINITPGTATNPLNANHTLTITVNSVNGTLGNGTATASIVSGPGSFVGSPSCNYTGGAATASCTVVITSAVAGTTVVQACSAIPVNGVSAITQCTGTAANTASGGSGNASKTWVNPQNPRRMTGGGSVFLGNLRITHGFELHCDVTRLPNRLEINWGKGPNENNFHLLTLTSASCFMDNSGFLPDPPHADFNTFVGTGTGRFNGVDGYTIQFTFRDHGEPGVNDLASYKITAPDGTTVVLNTGTPGVLVPSQDELPITKGNQQAHMH
jgi:hypothetical protein